MTLLSIIIPVYNAEKSIDRCIQSIFKQTINDYEIICVNDCSTDNTAQVLEEYSKKYDNFKYFNMEQNSGSGKCRNLGIKHARGDYIALLDSDDYIVDDDTYEVMINAAKEYGSMMVSANMQYQYEDEIVRTHHYFENITEIKVRKPEEYVIPWFHVKNIINRQFLVDNDIYFPDLKRGQDPVFLSNILTRIEFYVEVPVWYYCYTAKVPTINKMNNFEKFRDYLKCHDEVFKILDSKPEFKDTLKRYALEAKVAPNKIIPVYYKSELDEIVSLEKSILSTVKVGYSDIYDELRASFVSSMHRMIKQMKDDSPLVSIILPVYNTDKYLEKCINSIQKQTLKNFEVICVNDGSTDNSASILEKYEKEDERFHVITQKNQGLGNSRNNGVNVAHGDYILFLDSDDWIREDSLEELMINAVCNDSDIVLYNSVEEWADGHKRNRYYLNVDKKRDYNDYVFTYKSYINLVLNSFFTAPTKFFKRSFFIENDLFFRYRLFEDVEQNVESILSAERISYLPEILYFIRRGERDSLTSHTAKTDKSFILFDIAFNIQNNLKNRNVYDEFETEFHTFYLASMMNQLEQLDIDNKKRFFTILKKQLCEVNLDYEIVRGLDDKFYSFYMHVVNSENYLEFSVFENTMNNDIITRKEEILLNQIYEKNLEINRLEEENRKLWEYHEILRGISNDLLNGNLLTNDEIKKLYDYNLFDNEFYRLQYYYNSEVHPLIHYVYKGYKDNRNPSSVFDGKFYADKYDVQDMNPLVYYIKYGMKEGKISVNNTVKPRRELNLFDIEDKIDHLSEMGVTETKRDERIIVTLTSFPERIDEVAYTIYSLFNQQCKADEIVLWLSYEEFPNRENDLPRYLLLMKNYGLTIRWTENIGSYKKIIPALKEYSSDVLVTADDDIYYSDTWLEKLVHDHEIFPKSIISHRSRSIVFDEEDNLIKYFDWPFNDEESLPSVLNFLTSGGGALFPPHSFHEDVTNKKLFTTLAYGTDDIWLWSMAVLNHTPVKVVKDSESVINSTNTARDWQLTNQSALWDKNIKRNDENIGKIMDYYPELIEILLEENARKG